MKEYKYLYRKMLEDKTIRDAYKKLRKKKTKRKEIQYIDTHLDEEVEKMRIMILNTKPEGVEVPNPELRYIPPQRKAKIIFEHGKERKIYMPEIHEQWLHHIIIQILAPIITATAYRFSCGSFPKRGAHYGKRQIERWLRKDTKGMKYFLKIDIRHFYNNINLDILFNELKIRIKDEWFIYIIKVCLTGFKKGIPLGFYISQWLANYMLEPLDMAIFERYDKFQRYMDDITIFSSNKKKLHETLITIKKILGRRFRLKLKHNYQICRMYYEGKRIIGRPLDFMGFVFYRNKTIIRKNILLSAVRLAHKMKKSKVAERGYYRKHITAMLSYMGWFTCTNTYDAYKTYIKPCVCIKTLKKIISNLKKGGRTNMKQWTTEICDTQPDELQVIAPGLFIQRRNIKEVEHEATDNLAAYTDYECESREISISEYEMIKSVEQINTDKAIEEYTLQLMEEGVL